VIRIPLLLFTLICSIALLQCDGTAPAPDNTPTNLQIFLLAGQSNMAGRGEIEAEDRVPIPRVFALNRELEWTPAVEPVHFDRPYVGSGLARPFAKYLLEANPSASIGLVPCAVGGTGLNLWTPGGDLYENAITRMRVALKSGRLRAILWHQGESDSGSEELARSYRERWTRFIEGLRNDLGGQDVPVLIGQLGEFIYKEKGGNSPYAQVANEQLALIPLYVPKTAFVSAAGLTHKGDRVHFDRASLNELGRRFALAYLTLDPVWTRRAE
jgi:hypothetical protein